MTTKDTTRFLEQPRKHYAAAYLQQGRPLLDSDFNESARLLEEDRRRAFIDVTGGLGSPDLGLSLGLPIDEITPDVTPNPLRFPFEIETTEVSLNGTTVSVLPVSVLPGSVHLGGMRFELEHAEHIAFQRDFLQMKPSDVDQSAERTLYYLNAWQQCVTAVEDPELAEQALGGPDTTVRVRRMRRVEMSSVSQDVDECASAFEGRISEIAGSTGVFDWSSCELRSNGRLQLVFQGGSDGNPCTPDPPTQYLGTENQTLRIMLTGEDRFVWAIDNGAPLYRITVTGFPDVSRLRVVMVTPPRDREHQPRPNQVVEILPLAALLDRDTSVLSDDPHAGRLAAEMGVFTRVTAFDASDNSFTIEMTQDQLDQFSVDIVHTWDERHPDRTLLESSGSVRHFYMRLWHDAPNASDIQLSIDRNVSGPPVAPALGRTGILPIFHSPGRPGDYWTATLRVDARDRIVPFDLLTTEGGVPPHGPRHFYMPIGFVTRVPSTSSRDARDCRPRLRRLRDMSCETRTVGDGLKSIGDYKTIQKAIDSLPPTGGRVVVRPGIYREEVVVPPNVILEGCGEDTVLLSPETRAEPGLVRIVNGAAGVKVKNFRLQAISQAAVISQSAEQLELASLHVLAFRQGSSGPEPGAGGAGDDQALLDLSQPDGPVLRSIQIVASRRPALSMIAASDARIEGLSAAGDPNTEDAPLSTALVTFSGGVERLVMRDVSLTSFGQVALLLDANSAPVHDVVLSRLEILCGAHADGPQPTRSGIDVTGVDPANVENVVIERSRVVQEGSATDHAAIVVQGQQITIRDNFVESLPRCFDNPLPDNPEDCSEELAVAWGGIQVRGSSERIEVRGNHVRGGLGHGITLGSVRWQSGGGMQRREGAGKVLAKYPNNTTAYVDGMLTGFVDPSVGAFTALDEGPLTDVLVAENEIEHMATNGISVLSVLGLGLAASGTDFFEVERLRIENNRIHDNLRQLPTSVTTIDDVIPLSSVRPESNGTNHPLEVQALPYAGITLGTLTRGATISGNQIVNNGSSDVIPVCGLFVLNGDGITIARNRIVDNGGLASPTADLASGVRAGIAVLLAGTETASTSAALDAILAVESDPRVEAASLSLEIGDFALRILDNIVRQPEGRALYAVSTGMVSVDGNHLCSRGYHGSSSTVDQLAIGDVVFVQGLGGAWETFDALDYAAASGVDFQDVLAPNVSHGWLTNEIGGSPRLYVGGGGAVLFHDNQVLYDWDVKKLPPNPTETPLSFFPVVVLAQDHASAIGNQVSTRIQGVSSGDVIPPVPEVGGGQFLAQALIGGLTTQVARNRFAAPVLSETLSLITAAEILNTTVFNHGTHPMFAYRWRHPVSFLAPGNTSGPADTPRSFHFAANPALFVPADVDLTQLHNTSALVTAVRAFFRLMNQRTTP